MEITGQQPLSHIKVESHGFFLLGSPLVLLVLQLLFVSLLLRLEFDLLVKSVERLDLDFEVSQSLGLEVAPMNE